MKHLLLIALLLAGCSSDTEPDAGAARFVPDAGAASPAVALRENAVSEGALVLDVVGIGVNDLYGIAFRLETDPAVLTLERIEAASSWGASSITRAQEARPGLGYYVVTSKGTAAGRAFDDEVLATIHWRRTPGASPVQFVASRSAIVDSAGRELDAVSWIGGTLSTP